MPRGEEQLQLQNSLKPLLCVNHCCLFPLRFPLCSRLSILLFCISSSIIFLFAMPSLGHIMIKAQQTLSLLRRCHRLHISPPQHSRKKGCLFLFLHSARIKVSTPKIARSLEETVYCNTPFSGPANQVLD